MTVIITKKPNKGMGEARDLATFLDLVDRWTQGIPDLGDALSVRLPRRPCLREVSS
ncbi:hypothetical protein [Burkholderia sp. GbtcB21]|uniref:hypothetical protein n=1 Tax=Burkholderia sp. GbtcB21 TaxID=2824766 RepID=UPI001C30390B|nr:hypothetical protein [Burkholderia sp. GbtcB21]